MNDFVLICVKSVASFILYYIGIIVAGLGLLLVLASAADGFWWMALLGVPLLLAGVWIQYKNWGW